MALRGAEMARLEAEMAQLEAEMARLEAEMASMKATPMYTLCVLGGTERAVRHLQRSPFLHHSVQLVIGNVSGCGIPRL
ncbi:hypothetical protein WISP_92778 [Willisornis vidua]|uniref:Uncharacterized protein n=1 Tax=Willisornis vidua TaxID=1566151 RepID=A0ABQ9D0T9_9PASS|nr:hypothetical protein WISP_92778 [Willisornis vidua]